jgi:hypothetical protein
MKNPFAKIEPPLHKEPQIRYLLLSDIRRLLEYLGTRQNGYGSTLAFHLANAPRFAAALAHISRRRRLEYFWVKRVGSAFLKAT